MLEGLALLIGASLMSLLDDLVDIDIDTQANISNGGLTSLLGWLCLNKLPLLVWLVLLLTSFALGGLIYNYIVITTIQFEFLFWLSKPVALITALISTHYLGARIAKVIPKNESSATSTTEFAGRVATITLGKASSGNAAQAVLIDDYQQKHYVMVEPEQKTQEFPQGTDVVLLEKKASSWIAASLKQ
ncbi:DUF1449 family protein [Thalassomonas sp. M1454]|nr:DUF1449 family protein [Thalassomonas sp. M1454]